MRPKPAVERGFRAGLPVLLVLVAACQGAGESNTAELNARIDCPLTAPVMPSTGDASVPPVSTAADESASPVPTPMNAAELLAGVSTATVETSLGSFTITLNPDTAPIATANFVALARCGFYDGIAFHRVLTGFVAQAGDPNTRENQDDFEGLGTGGPGYGFAIELPPEGLTYDPYTVAMANTGEANSNGSQYFICLADIDARLPGRNYTIFGLVTDGREVVDAIGQVEVNHPNLGVPVDPVIIRDIQLGSAESTPS